MIVVTAKDTRVVSDSPAFVHVDVKKGLKMA